MKIFFANEAKNKIEKDYLNKLVDRMENNSFEVCWPDRNLPKNIKTEKAIKQWRLEKISAAPIFALALDGHSLDEQMFIDLGTAYSLANNDQPKKLLCAMEIAGLKPNKKTEQAVLTTLDCIAKGEYDFIDCLKSYLKTANKY